MKQRIDSVAFCSLAWSLVITGGSILGFAGHAAGSPVPLPPSSWVTNGLTLEGAVRLALDSNPELHASSGRIDAAAGRAYQAKLWSNPELTLNAEDWPVSEGDGFSNSKQTVGVAQTIPFPGKKKLDRQIGVSSLRVSEVDLSLRRLELVRDVKIAFYQVLAAERLVEVQGELVKVAESSAATDRCCSTADSGRRGHSPHSKSFPDRSREAGQPFRPVPLLTDFRRRPGLTRQVWRRGACGRQIYTG